MEGLIEGGTDGSFVGLIVGVTLGKIVGLVEGFCVGSVVGTFDGVVDGSLVNVVGLNVLYKIQRIFILTMHFQSTFWWNIYLTVKM